MTAIPVMRSNFRVAKAGVVMICMFADRETERVAAGLRSRKLPQDIQDRAFRMLLQMGRVQDWNELRNPPGNRLHALSGDREANML